jgi:hypothetical protein
MRYKLTKKDFTEFQTECERWVDYFGMKDWEVCFDREDEECARASCLADYTGKIAMICLTNEWHNPPQKNEIKKVAFHEVVELLLAPLRAVAVARFATEDEIEVADHYIVRVLENTIFKEKIR